MIKLTGSKLGNTGINIPDIYHDLCKLSGIM